MIYRRVVIALMLFSASVSCGFAATSAAPESKAVSAATIRQVDFLNFTYHPKLCTQRYAKEGVGKAVRVHNGEFNNGRVYYGVVDNKVLYGDLTQDGAEEAVVHIGCGYFVANYGLSEIFVFTQKGNKTAALASLSDNDLTRDYRRYFPGGILWRITDSGVRVAAESLMISAFADGSHASPDYIVTFRYRWNGKKFHLKGKPKRRKFSR